MRRLAALRSDAGFTVAEMSVTALLASVLLVVLGTFLTHSYSTGAFTQGQSATINAVRNVMQQIEKEARGADSIVWCAPVGTCLEVGAQTPDGGFRTVRYKHVNSELQRELFNSSTLTWGEPLTVVDRVTNTVAQPVFTCDTQSTLLRMTVDLHIEPTPQSDPNLRVRTSIRPRNFPSKAICP